MTIIGTDKNGDEIAEVSVSELNTMFEEIRKKTIAEYNNGWIKCKDKLPEKTQRYYLVRYEICVAETVLRFTGKDYFTSDGKWEIEGRESDTKVTYWQPLPKPPKGECYKDEKDIS